MRVCAARTVYAATHQADGSF